MNVRLFAATILLLLLALAAGPAFGQVRAAEDDSALQDDRSARPPDNGEEILERAQNLYEYGDYAGMVKLLSGGLNRKIFENGQLTSVHRLLGIGHFILQNRNKSREHFLRLLTKDPDHQLDPLYVPPIIIDFYEGIREEHKEMLDAIRIQQRKEEERRREQAAEKIVLKKNPYFVNFIPFGAGQFQNGKAVKGTLFLTGQAIALSLNITGYWIAENLEGEDGYYSKADARTAKNWRIVQYASLGVLGALVIGGIVDALLDHREFEKIEMKPKPKGEEEEKEAAETARKGPELEWTALRLRF